MITNPTTFKSQLLELNVLPLQSEALYLFRYLLLRNILFVRGVKRTRTREVVKL